MPSPTDEQIAQLLPFLKHTNPHLSEEELVVLAKKMLSMPATPDETSSDKPLSEMMEGAEDKVDS
ncbi:hypothetical protein J4227_04990 [Candidatus Woesearchaeota archaeon]|nr:hypothetical protein [Candidatus Woesearchaeota archaeon]